MRRSLKVLSTVASLWLTVAVLSACAPAREPMPTLPIEVAEALEQLRSAKDDATAERAMQVALDFWLLSKSASVNFLMERASIAEAHLDPEKAARLVTEAITLDPTFAEAYARRASLAFAREDFAAALRDLERATQLEPRHFVALTGLGAVYEALRRPADALRAYRAALAVHPRLSAAIQGEARTARVVEGVET